MTVTAHKILKQFVIALLIMLTPHLFLIVRAQQIEKTAAEIGAPSSVAKYLDPAQGITADALVTFALKNNGELLALGNEIEAAAALVKQAKLKANPTLDFNGAKQIGGADNNLMIAGALPLELGGRRNARMLVAEREVEIRQQILADRERLLAAEVRAKFGETLAAGFKLRFVEEMLGVATTNYNLVAATVAEGRRPPLEQNVETVELNRLRAMRETSEGKIEIALLELRNLVGMSPEEPLRLRGDFEDLLEVLPPLAVAVAAALLERPDLQRARAAEDLATAQIAQARAGGRLDASVTAGYQRMDSSFPVNGFNDAGILRPVRDVFNFFTFGVTLSLPVRNRNQGEIEAAVTAVTAARNRREFGELTIRRETAVAYARYARAARAMQIYRVGVREQAGANLLVVRRVYELGSKPLFDYIAEQRRFIEIENGFIDAQLETYLAGVEILRATAAPRLIKK